jgi:hypothetical protein
MSYNPNDALVANSYLAGISMFSSRLFTLENDLKQIQYQTDEYSVRTAAKQN